MIQIFMAGALALLALARVPALRRNSRDPVFFAAAFAGASSLLLSPDVYFAVDRILGGFNLTRLAINSFMIVGLWFLRNAVVSAVTQQRDTRSLWGRTLPVTLTLALQAAFFFLAGTSPSTRAWMGDGHHPVQVGLFSMMLIGFIAWSCAEIAWACFRYVPQMRRAFRIGFSMVGTGAAVAVAVMVIMCTGELAALAGNAVLHKAIQALPVHIFEMVAIILVGVGLTIPAVAGRSARKQAALRLDRTIAKVEVIHQKALQNSDMDRTLLADRSARPHERLHRMIVEIWDAELAAGGRAVLDEEDRAYLLLVESDFGLERTS
jgi:hypothetical protein